MYCEYPKKRVKMKDGGEVKLGSGMAEKARKKIKGRKARLAAALKTAGG